MFLSSVNIYWVPSACRHSARPQGYKMSKKDPALQYLRLWWEKLSHKSDDMKAWAQVQKLASLAFNVTFHPSPPLPQSICSPPSHTQQSLHISTTITASMALFAGNHLSTPFSLSNSVTDQCSSRPWNIPQYLHIHTSFCEAIMSPVYSTPSIRTIAGDMCLIISSPQCTVLPSQRYSLKWLLNEYVNYLSY